MTTDAATALDFDDRTDFDDADRGFVGKLVPGAVRDAAGEVVWDSDQFDFLDGDRPDTVDESLWRQSQLTARQGLYEVTDGIYQVRGMDLSNMSVIEGADGIIVIDPLISAETASAALALYRTHRGDRPVSAVIFTHSHIDHFGGILGIISADDKTPILAPQGFLDHSVVENVYAGTAMLRRGMYYAGANLERSADGLVGVGLGSDTSHGLTALLPATLDITATGQEETVDGVRMTFQLTPNTEAPSEMNILFPDRRAVCMAENATHNLHNILTLRGAVVRDARIWSRYLNEAIGLFGDAVDVEFASHHWPTWGRDRIVRFLAEQRDLYGYLHDQTLRLMNQGYIGSEIAEMLTLPPALDRRWHTRGYYGSLSHNVKAIYQRYLGWYDGNPAHLWQHPPIEAGKRYVEAIGGPAAVVDKARTFIDRGDLRFAAELLSHAVFADESDADARDLLATTFERLGHGAENGTWRNCYLTGAAELRTGIKPTGLSAGGFAAGLTITQLFDSVAIRIDGPKAWDLHLTIDWRFTDTDETYRTELSNGFLVHHRDPAGGHPDLTLTLTKSLLLAMLAGGGLAGVGVDGDPSTLERLMAVLDGPDPNFAVVTP